MNEPREPDDELDWSRLRDNRGELAAMMLRLVDKSPDRLAVLEVPQAVVRTDADTDEAERMVSSEFERAQRERPNLVFKLSPATPEYPDAALLIAIHEHEWVGGHCVHGCGEEQVPP